MERNMTDMTIEDRRSFISSSGLSSQQQLVSGTADNTGKPNQTTA